MYIYIYITSGQCQLMPNAPELIIHWQAGHPYLSMAVSWKRVALSPALQSQPLSATAVAPLSLAATGVLSLDRMIGWCRLKWNSNQ